MTVSGSRDFNLDVGEIIEEAYERCGLEVRTGYDARTARRSLNLMFAEWANRGLNLWTVKQGTIPGTCKIVVFNKFVTLVTIALSKFINSDAFMNLTPSIFSISFPSAAVASILEFNEARSFILN